MTEDFEFYKNMSLDSLTITTNEIKQSYEKLYDLAKDNENREAVFLKELVDILIQINAVTSVYVRDNGIHPNYALEKLNYAESLLQCHIRFWESKSKESE